MYKRTREQTLLGERLMVSMMRKCRPGLACHHSVCERFTGCHKSQQRGWHTTAVRRRLPGDISTCLATLWDTTIGHTHTQQTHIQIYTHVYTLYTQKHVTHGYPRTISKHTHKHPLKHKESSSKVLARRFNCSMLSGQLPHCISNLFGTNLFHITFILDC